MKKEELYDPEDLESLMLHKSFQELYPEEKEFVLRHLEGPDEYESMRRTLFAVQKELHSGTGIKPRPEIRQQLMEQFAQKKSIPAWRLWLNSVFQFDEPLFRWLAPVGIASAVLLGWFLLLDQEAPVARLAERKQSTEKVQKQLERSESFDTEGQIEKETESPAIIDDSPMEESFDSEESPVEMLEEESLDFADSEIQENDLPIAQAKEIEITSEDDMSSGNALTFFSDAATSSSPVSRSISSTAFEEELVKNVNSNIARTNAASDSDLFALFFTAY